MQKKIKSCLWLTVGFMGFTFGAPSWAAEPNLNDPVEELNLPNIVARVNGVEISSKFIKFKFNTIRKRMDKASPQNIQIQGRNQNVEIVRRIIDAEVIRELLYQTAKTKNRKADPKDVEKELADLKSIYKDEGEFLVNLKQRGITLEALKQNIATDILIRDLADGQIKGKINISDADIKKYYDDNLEDFKRPEAYKTRHILIPHFTRKLLKGIPQKDLMKKRTELSEQARKKSEKILAEIRAGADFEEMAKKYSQDAGTADKGGDLDFIYKGIFDPAFDEAVSKLKPQEISDVVKTNYGYHIIQLIETRPPDTAQFSDLQGVIQRILFAKKAQQKLQEYTDQLRKKAKIKIFY